MDLQKLIDDVERHARQTEKTPEHICRKASGSPTLYARLKRRLDQTLVDAERIQKVIETNEGAAQ